MSASSAASVGWSWYVGASVADETADVAARTHVLVPLVDLLEAVLARDQLVPIVHNTTYTALRDVSPMLASRNGLDTAEDTMAEVAAKLAELVALPSAA